MTDETATCKRDGCDWPADWHKDKELCENHALEEFVEEENQKVRNRSECIVCDADVADDEHSWKYVQAGGFLSGPFCSERCHWEWLNDD